MQTLYRRDLRECMNICPLKSESECADLCSKSAAINAYNERGKLFNVVFQAPPIQDLDTGTTDEEAWASLGQRAFSRAPWQPATRDLGSLPFNQSIPYPLANMAEMPVDCPASNSLQGAFWGWNRVPDGLWQRTFVPSADQQFARAVDLNQAMSGYLVDPVVQAAQDGPLSALKPTAGNSAAYLPQAQPFAGIGFNLSNNVPRSGVANVRGVPTLFEPPSGNGVRSFHLANLSA